MYSGQFWGGWQAHYRRTGFQAITGLEALSPTQDDLKSVCAVFGTTSGAAMLHISGHTPEADLPVAEGAITHNIDISDLQQAWHSLNQASLPVDLIAIGSPHASFSEVKESSAFSVGHATPLSP